MRSSSILPIICLRDGLRFLRTSALSLRCHSTSFVVVLALLAPHLFCLSGEGDGATATATATAKAKARVGNYFRR
jgi:hypothetical protein